ncbi:hypothetical protein TNCV_3868351 [Trichonephila clavipes]|nr:hypothetical protein TNCV_3868351 [Trichonephila clavipes]
MEASEKLGIAHTVMCRLWLSVQSDFHMDNARYALPPKTSLRQHYGGAGVLVLGGIVMGSRERERADANVQIGNVIA